MPDRLLRALDWRVRKRIDGLLSGEHQATLLGPGLELAQIRRYEPGDDVRAIDWNVTARTGEAHVREYVAEKAMTMWVLLDQSASMAFGTQDRRKADVARGVVLAAGHLAARSGNRLGIMTFGNGAPQVVPPARGRAGMIAVLRALEAAPQRAAGATSVGEVLERAARTFRTRGAIVIVSDWRGPSDWRDPLIQLVARHDVLAAEIADEREVELPDVGELWLVDVETGRQLRADTGDARIRQRFSEAASRERTEVRRAIRATGADHVLLTTSGDWLRSLAAFLVYRRRRR